MKMYPDSHWGKWTVKLIVVFFIAVVANAIVLRLEGASIFVYYSLLAISFGAGIGAAVTGIISIVKNRETSLVVYIGIFIGVMMLVSLFTEIAG